MKISLNWLKEYVDIDVSDEELIRLIGARLVEVEGVIDERHKYDNIFVVRVEKAEKIPDTHLTLCQINDGSEELIQVVCGAPNVYEGMLAAWIKPGAVVPASVHEDAPFVIGKRKMLGKYDSNGMLAGADELDLDDRHEKIVEISPEMAQPGDLLADVFQLNDLILEIENKSLTHRPDCFGIIGFAREVAGILGKRFKDPDFLFRETVFPEGFLVETRDSLKSKDAAMTVEIADQAVCPRYSCAVLKVADATGEDKYLSPMQVKIAKSGTMPKSRIVDVTNYLMYLTGQPLHAFDYDKFVAVGGSEAPRINVRTARAGEKIVLLDGADVSLNKNDIVICSNDIPVALAGAMGGVSTMIDEQTKNIILESATFSLYNLRKTQMSHGIFSEAITRFTKGVPAAGTFNVLAEAVREIGGKSLEVCDVFPEPKPAPVVKITADEINDLLGTKYTYDEIEQTLRNVGFGISCDCGKEDACNCEYISVTAPTWRTDIHIKEDIVEEVGRLLGYDNIEPTLPLHATAAGNVELKLKRDIREWLSRHGANEVLTYSFVSERLLEKAGQDKKNAYKIVNSISPDLQYMRESLMPSLLDKAYLNVKLPVDEFAIFEMNKVYQKECGVDNDKVPVERMNLGFVVAERKSTETAFYKAKKYVDGLLKQLGMEVEYRALSSSVAMARPFEKKRAAEILTKDGALVGIVGEFKNSVKSNFKLGDYLAGFEVDLGVLLEKAAKDQKIDLSKKEVRDLTIKTNKTYGEVVAKIADIIEQNGLVAEILPGAIYQPDGADEKSITVRLQFTKFDEKIMSILENL